jgi:hypothetical protein
MDCHLENTHFSVLGEFCWVVAIVWICCCHCVFA